VSACGTLLLSEVEDVSSRTPGARTVAYVPLAATVPYPGRFEN